MVMRDGGHCPHDDSPDALHAELLPWIKGLLEGPPWSKGDKGPRGNGPVAGSRAPKHAPVFATRPAGPGGLRLGGLFASQPPSGHAPGGHSPGPSTSVPGLRGGNLYASVGSEDLGAPPPYRKRY